MATNRQAASQTKAKLKAMKAASKKKVAKTAPAQTPAKRVVRYHLSADHNGAYAYRQMD